MCKTASCLARMHRVRPVSLSLSVYTSVYLDAASGHPDRSRCRDDSGST